MRILQLCQKPPYPAVDGGCIAMNQISEQLVKLGHELDILAMETYKHPLLQSKISDDWRKKVSLQTVFVDIKVRFIPAFLNLFSSKSYNVQRFYSSHFEQKLEEILENKKIDAVVFESLYTTVYLKCIQQHKGIKTLYRAHNIEQEIWKYHSENQNNPLKRWYFNSLYRKLRKYELEMLPKFDAVAAISENEKRWLKEHGAPELLEAITVYSAVSGIEEIKRTAGLPGFFHLGSMDWKPNQDGIKWLLDEVWKQDEIIESGAKLKLAGRSMPDWLKNLNQPNVEILGEVPDASVFIRQNDVMLVPLFTGSGIRIKIIEAMSMGKTVVCTSIAAQGIAYTDKENILIANSVKAFVEAIASICQGKIDCKAIGEKAASYIQSAHHPEATAGKLGELLAALNKGLNK